MKEFYQWLINIGYTEKELETLPENHLHILEEEYINLLSNK